MPIDYLGYLRFTRITRSFIEGKRDRGLTEQENDMLEELRSGIKELLPEMVEYGNHKNPDSNYSREDLLKDEARLGEKLREITSQAIETYGALIYALNEEKKMPQNRRMSLRLTLTTFHRLLNNLLNLTPLEPIAADLPALQEGADTPLDYKGFMEHVEENTDFIEKEASELDENLLTEDERGAYKKFRGLVLGTNKTMGKYGERLAKPYKFRQTDERTLKTALHDISSLASENLVKISNALVEPSLPGDRKEALQELFFAYAFLGQNLTRFVSAPQAVKAAPKNDAVKQDEPKGIPVVPQVQLDQNPPVVSPVEAPVQPVANPADGQLNQLQGDNANANENPVVANNANEALRAGVEEPQNQQNQQNQQDQPGLPEYYTKLTEGLEESRKLVTDSGAVLNTLPDPDKIKFQSFSNDLNSMAERFAAYSANVRGGNYPDAQRMADEKANIAALNQFKATTSNLMLEITRNAAGGNNANAMPGYAAAISAINRAYTAAGGFLDRVPAAEPEVQPGAENNADEEPKAGGEEPEEVPQNGNPAPQEVIRDAGPQYTNEIRRAGPQYTNEIEQFEGENVERQEIPIVPQVITNKHIIALTNIRRFAEASDAMDQFNPEGKRMMLDYLNNIDRHITARIEDYIKKATSAEGYDRAARERDERTFARVVDAAANQVDTTLQRFSREQPKEDREAELHDFIMNVFTRYSEELADIRRDYTAALQPEIVPAAEIMNSQQEQNQPQANADDNQPNQQDAADLYTELHEALRSSAYNFDNENYRGMSIFHLDDLQAFKGRQRTVINLLETYSKNVKDGSYASDEARTNAEAEIIARVKALQTLTQETMTSFQDLTGDAYGVSRANFKILNLKIEAFLNADAVKQHPPLVELNQNQPVNAANENVNPVEGQQNPPLVEQNQAPVDAAIVNGNQQAGVIAEAGNGAGQQNQAPVEQNQQVQPEVAVIYTNLRKALNHSVELFDTEDLRGLNDSRREDIAKFVNKERAVIDLLDTYSKNVRDGSYTNDEARTTAEAGIKAGVNELKALATETAAAFDGNHTDAALSIRGNIAVLNLDIEKFLNPPAVQQVQQGGNADGAQHEQNRNEYVPIDLAMVNDDQQANDQNNRQEEEEIFANDGRQANDQNDRQAAELDYTQTIDDLNASHKLYRDTLRSITDAGDLNTTVGFSNLDKANVYLVRHMKDYMAKVRSGEDYPVEKRKAEEKYIADAMVALRKAAVDLSETFHLKVDSLGVDDKKRDGCEKALQVAEAFCAAADNFLNANPALEQQNNAPQNNAPQDEQPQNNAQPQDQQPQDNSPAAIIGNFLTSLEAPEKLYEEAAKGNVTFNRVSFPSDVLAGLGAIKQDLGAVSDYANAYLEKVKNEADYPAELRRRNEGVISRALKDCSNKVNKTLETYIKDLGEGNHYLSYTGSREYAIGVLNKYSRAIESARMQLTNAHAAYDEQAAQNGGNLPGQPIDYRPFINTMTEASQLTKAALNKRQPVAEGELDELKRRLDRMDSLTSEMNTYIDTIKYKIDYPDDQRKEDEEFLTTALEDYSYLVTKRANELRNDVPKRESEEDKTRRLNAIAIYDNYAAGINAFLSAPRPVLDVAQLQASVPAQVTKPIDYRPFIAAMEETNKLADAAGGQDSPVPAAAALKLKKFSENVIALTNHLNSYLTRVESGSPYIDGQRMDHEAAYAKEMRALETAAKEHSSEMATAMRKPEISENARKGYREAHGIYIKYFDEIGAFLENMPELVPQNNAAAQEQLQLEEEIVPAQPGQHVDYSKLLAALEGPVKTLNEIGHDEGKKESERVPADARFVLFQFSEELRSVTDRLKAYTEKVQSGANYPDEQRIQDEEENTRALRSLQASALKGPKQIDALLKTLAEHVRNYEEGKDSDAQKTSPERAEEMRAGYARVTQLFESFSAGLRDFLGSEPELPENDEAGLDVSMDVSMDASMENHRFSVLEGAGIHPADPNAAEKMPWENFHASKPSAEGDPVDPALILELLDRADGIKAYTDIEYFMANYRNADNVNPFAEAYSDFEESTDELKQELRTYAAVFHDLGAAERRQADLYFAEQLSSYRDAARAAATQIGNVLRGMSPMDENFNEFAEAVAFYDAAVQTTEEVEALRNVSAFSKTAGRLLSEEHPVMREALRSAGNAPETIPEDIREYYNGLSAFNAACADADFDSTYEELVRRENMIAGDIWMEPTDGVRFETLLPQVKTATLKQLSDIRTNLRNDLMPDGKKISDDVPLWERRSMENDRKFLKKKLDALDSYIELRVIEAKKSALGRAHRREFGFAVDYKLDEYRRKPTENLVERLNECARQLEGYGKIGANSTEFNEFRDALEMAAQGGSLSALHSKAQNYINLKTAGGAEPSRNDGKNRLGMARMIVSLTRFNKLLEAPAPAVSEADKYSLRRTLRAYARELDGYSKFGANSTEYKEFRDALTRATTMTATAADLTNLYEKAENYFNLKTGFSLRNYYTNPPRSETGRKRIELARKILLATKVLAGKKNVLSDAQETAGAPVSAEVRERYAAQQNAPFDFNFNEAELDVQDDNRPANFGMDEDVNELNVEPPADFGQDEDMDELKALLGDPDKQEHQNDESASEEYNKIPMNESSFNLGGGEEKKGNQPQGNEEELEEGEELIFKTGPKEPQTIREKVDVWEIGAGVAPMAFMNEDSVEEPANTVPGQTKQNVPTDQNNVPVDDGESIDLSLEFGKGEEKKENQPQVNEVNQIDAQPQVNEENLIDNQPQVDEGNQVDAQQQVNQPRPWANHIVIPGRTVSHLDTELFRSLIGHAESLKAGTAMKDFLETSARKYTNEGFVVPRSEFSTHERRLESLKAAFNAYGSAVNNNALAGEERRKAEQYLAEQIIFCRASALGNAQRIETLMQSLTPMDPDFAKFGELLGYYTASAQALGQITALDNVYTASNDARSKLSGDTPYMREALGADVQSLERSIQNLKDNNMEVPAAVQTLYDTYTELRQYKQDCQNMPFDGAYDALESREAELRKSLWSDCTSADIDVIRRLVPELENGTISDLCTKKAEIVAGRFPRDNDQFRELIGNNGTPFDDARRILQQHVKNIDTMIGLRVVEAEEAALAQTHPTAFRNRTLLENLDQRNAPAKEVHEMLAVYAEQLSNYGKFGANSTEFKNFRDALEAAAKGGPLSVLNREAQKYVTLKSAENRNAGPSRDNGKNRLSMAKLIVSLTQFSKDIQLEPAPMTDEVMRPLHYDLAAYASELDRVGKTGANTTEYKEFRAALTRALTPNTTQADIINLYEKAEKYRDLKTNYDLNDLTRERDTEAGRLRLRTAVRVINLTRDLAGKATLTTRPFSEAGEVISRQNLQPIFARLQEQRQAAANANQQVQQNQPIVELDQPGQQNPQGQPVVEQNQQGRSVPQDQQGQPAVAPVQQNQPVQPVVEPDPALQAFAGKYAAELTSIFNMVGEEIDVNLAVGYEQKDRDDLLNIAREFNKVKDCIEELGAKSANADYTREAREADEKNLVEAIDGCLVRINEELPKLEFDPVNGADEYLDEKQLTAEIYDTYKAEFTAIREAAKPVFKYYRVPEEIANHPEQPVGEQGPQNQPVQQDQPNPQAAVPAAVPNPQAAGDDANKLNGLDLTESIANMKTVVEKAKGSAEAIYGKRDFESYFRALDFISKVETAYKFMEDYDKDARKQEGYPDDQREKDEKKITGYLREIAAEADKGIAKNSQNGKLTETAAEADKGIAKNSQSGKLTKIYKDLKDVLNTTYFKILNDLPANVRTSIEIAAVREAEEKERLKAVEDSALYQQKDEDTLHQKDGEDPSRRNVAAEPKTDEQPKVFANKHTIALTGLRKYFDDNVGNYDISEAHISLYGKLLDQCGEVKDRIEELGKKSMRGDYPAAEREKDEKVFAELAASKLDILQRGQLAYYNTLSAKQLQKPKLAFLKDFFTKYAEALSDICEDPKAALQPDSVVKSVEQNNAPNMDDEEEPENEVIDEDALEEVNDREVPVDELPPFVVGNVQIAKDNLDASVFSKNEGPIVLEEDDRKLCIDVMLPNILLCRLSEGEKIEDIFNDLDKYRTQLEQAFFPERKAYEPQKLKDLVYSDYDNMIYRFELTNLQNKAVANLQAGTDVEKAITDICTTQTMLSKGKPKDIINTASVRNAFKINRKELKGNPDFTAIRDSISKNPTHISELKGLKSPKMTATRLLGIFNEAKAGLGRTSNSRPGQIGDPNKNKGSINRNIH